MQIISIDFCSFNFNCKKKSQNQPIRNTLNPFFSFTFQPIKNQFPLLLPSYHKYYSTTKLLHQPPLSECAHGINIKESKNTKWIQKRQCQPQRPSHTLISDSDTSHLFCISAIALTNSVFWCPVLLMERIVLHFASDNIQTELTGKYCSSLQNIIDILNLQKTTNQFSQRLELDFTELRVSIPVKTFLGSYLVFEALPSM